MKKFLFFSLLAFLLTPALSCFAEEQNSFDVRKVRWGMSKDEVLKSELPNKLYGEKDGYYSFKETIFDYPCYVSYLIKNDKLVEVYFIFDKFDKKHTTSSLKTKFKIILGKKYKKVGFVNDQKFEKMSENEKEIFRKLQLKLEENNIQYENDRTFIVVYDNQDNSDRTVTVIYTDKKYRVIEEEEYKNKKQQERKQFQKDASQF